MPTFTADEYPTRAADRITPARSTQDRTQWSKSEPAVGRYLAALDALGLEDPAGAAEPYARALELRHTPPVHHDALDEQAVAAKVAAGTMTVAQAATAVTKAQAASTTEAQHKRQRQLLARAAITAYTEAGRRIRAIGDGIIVDLLRPEVADCLANPVVFTNTARWDQLHDLAELLRTAGLVPTCGASRIEHAFGDPYAVHLHRLDHARLVRQRHSEHDERTGITWLTRFPVDPEPITLIAAAQHPEWRPGIYTASEVLDHLGAVRQSLLNLQPQPLGAA